MSERYTSDKTGWQGSSVFSLFQKLQTAAAFQKSVVHPRIFRVDRSCPSDENDIVSGLEKGRIQPVNFTKSAADAVSAYGIADFCGDRDSEPVDIRSVSAAVHNKEGTDAGLSFGIDMPEIAVFLN